MASTLQHPERSRGKLHNLRTILLYFSILIFLIAFNFTDSPPPPFGWYQQFMPTGLPNFQVSDIFFIDSLTGWAVTGNSNPNDTSGYILKTTNSGDNWTLKFTDVRDFSRVKFLINTTGFVSGGYNTGARLYKTTNGGDNWYNIYNLSQIYLSDMSVLNQDTIWVVDNDGLTGGVFLTTNGGVNWTQKYYQFQANPSHIYMYNATFGFMNGGGLKRTTDGGNSWTPILNENFQYMYFIDSLTGWKCNLDMKKTTNGGLNWVSQTLPYGGLISMFGAMLRFSNVNKDTIWGVGNYLDYGGNRWRGIIYITNNGGDNWYFQLPDTSIQIPQYLFIKFINKRNGWAYSSYFSQQANSIISGGLHTVTGGDTVLYIGIIQKSKVVPKKFILKQNYPNPFNPRTLINYELRITSYVRLIVYDITGREVQRLVDQRQTAGEYEVDFMGKFVSSGVYLYRMQVTDEKGNQTFSDTKKMILLK